MISKINIYNLVKEHFNTFYLKDKTKTDGKRNDVLALLLFFIAPMIIAGLLVFFFGNIRNQLIDSLLICLSILSPLMFGFFPFIYDLIDNKTVNPKSLDYVKEFKANVLFTMMLSFTSLAFIIIWTFANSNLDFCTNLDKNYITVLINYILLILSFIIYYFLFCLGFHILMIIQRFNFLINEYFKFKKNNG